MGGSWAFLSRKRLGVVKRRAWVRCFLATRVQATHHLGMQGRAAHQFSEVPGLGFYTRQKSF